MPKRYSTLVVTLGSKPQLVTLAVDCLQQKGEVPDEVIVVHASRERAETQKALLLLEGVFPEDYPNINLQYLQLEKDGKPLRDVTSPEQVEVAFQMLYSTVRMMKIQDKAVHLLIAGGRRTLTVFGMAVAQILFDDQDNLWHIASHPALEESGNLHVSGDEWARLIPIPVIAWGRLSPVFDVLRSVDDPFMAAKQLGDFRLREQWDVARIFMLAKLSHSESSVVSLLVQEGLNQTDIAERLSISLRTVEQHLRSVYRKAEEHWETENMNQARLIRMLGLYFSTYRGP
jgi:CRISPR-associated protein Csx14